MKKEHKKNTLYLFTATYPYGSGESFVENELRVLASKFDEICIFPMHSGGMKREPVAENISVISLFENKRMSKWKLLARYFFMILRILSLEYRNTVSKNYFIHSLPLYRSMLLQNLFRAEALEAYLAGAKNDNITFYSFWTDDWATVLGVLKEKKIISSFVSRVHGYDLYKERWDMNVIPFRNFQFRQVAKVFAVSSDGFSYLKKNYPEQASKFYLSHLSALDNGMAGFDEQGVFTIVSCSNLIPLKRVHLLAAALKQVSFELKWVHFGDGEERQKILGLISELPSNITATLMGSVPHAELISFYKAVPVHAFIHLSETEGGVPLSLQEAAGFGIPLIGTTAGGAAEIVNENTGIPLGNAVAPDELAEVIRNFKDSEKNTMAFRAGVRKFWQQSFNAETVYTDFYKKITEQ